MPIRLGPFALDRRIASGAYGHIWRGVHGPSDLPVAVKVITDSLARDARAFEGFRREVQAVARLTHPRIVTLFDYGTISEAAGTGSEGELTPGSPYLVMEYAPLGSLDRRLAGTTWTSMLRTLRAVLGALAHAHARGLVHRDLKPANILLLGDTMTSARLALTDFGIAQLTDEQPLETSGASSTRESAKGTPAFMAPEQFEGRWLEYGPWTDLYALGIMAWEMATGELTFVGESFIECAMMHLREPPPAFEPLFEVPGGFDDWLGRLIAKKPAERYQCAADALHALDAISAGFVDASPSVDEVPSTNVAPTLSTANFARNADYGRTRTLTGDLTHETVDSGTTRVSLAERTLISAGALHPLLAPEPGRGTPPVVERYVPELPPMPPSWRELVTTGRPSQLLGAGLGLYGLRAVPMVGREDERDQLWHAMADVRGTRRPHAVVLRGSAGYGKTRLAEWLAATATEAGTASVMRAQHGPTSSSRRALTDLVSRYLRVVGLPAPRMRRRVQQVMEQLGATEPWEWRGLADLLSSELAADAEAVSDAPPTRPVRIGARSERHAVVAGLLQRAGAARPLVVFFDDVQWGADALTFVEFVLDFDPSVEIPVLFVLTAQDEALAEREQEPALLARLTQRADVTEIGVGPLDGPSSRRLVEQLLFLSGPLARRVEDRVAGNPLYATQLVGDWVERGLLVADRTGFRLRPGVDAPLPDDLFSLWMGRVERVIAGQPPGALAALSLCAVLGQHLNDAELGRAQQIAGLALPSTLRDALTTQGLATGAVAGWSFSHAMLRETLVRNARETGLLGSHHSACADMLSDLYGAADIAVAERLARHLLAAGRNPDALGPLLLASRDRVESGEYVEALALLDEHVRILDASGATTDDPRRVGSAIWRAHAWRNLWELNEAESQAAFAIRLARQHGLDAARAEALAILGHVARLRGHLRRAEDLNREALHLFSALGDDRGLALALRAMAVTLRERSRFDEAITSYGRALALFERLGMDRDVVECFYGLGNVHRQRRDFGDAEGYYRRARELAERSGNVHQIAECDNGLAEVARYAGRLDDAETLYREALRRMTSVGSRGAVYPRLNLALTLILRGHYKVARNELQRALPELEASGNRGVLAWALVHLLPCEVALGDMDAAVRTFERARFSLNESSMVDTDIAEAAELTASLCASAGRDEMAHACWSVAVEQWSTLGVEDRRLVAAACRDGYAK